MASSGKKKKVAENQARGRHLPQFRAVTAPPAKAFIKDDKRGEDSSDGIQFTSGAEGGDACKDQQKKRDAVKRFAGQSGNHS